MGASRRAAAWVFPLAPVFVACVFSGCWEEAEHPFPARGGSAGRDAGKPGGGGGAVGSVSSGGATQSAGTLATGGGTASGAGNAFGGAPSAGGAASDGGATTGGKSDSAGRGGTSGGTVTTGGRGGVAGGGRGGSGGVTAAGGGKAGASTGGVSGGQSGKGSCAAEDYLLCEDFEGTAVGDVPDGWTRHGELAAVSDAAAKSGVHSLELRPHSNAERRLYHDAALLGGAHWGRIHYKVKSPVPDAFVHSTLVSFLGDAPTRGRSEFRTIDTVKQAVDTRDVGSKFQYLYNVQVIGSSEFAREGPYDQEFEDVWHCVEYRIDASNQSYALYVDGEEELSFENGEGNFERSEIPDSFEELRVGWVNYQSAPPGFTAWIDDIAFDAERIGCAP